MQKFTKKRLYQLIAILAIIFILAVLGVFYLSQKKVKDDLRSELDWSSEVVLSAINPNRIEKASRLIGDREAILKDNDLNWLKGEIERMGDIFFKRGVDAIYILVKHGANIYFLAESTPVGDDLYIEPGTQYQNPPMEVFSVFDKKTASYSDTYTDEYGTYFSKFSPILNDNNQIVGVLGTDIERSYFQSNINKTRILLLLILVLVFSIAYFVIFHVRKKEMIAQEARDNNKRTISLINSIPNGIVVYDKNGIIDLWNKTAEKMFGFKYEDVVGKKVSNYIKYDNVFKSNSDIEIKNFKFSAERNKLNSKIELRIKKEDSTIKVIEVMFDSMEISGKLYTIALFDDISNRKLKEFEIERQKNKLEKLNSLMVDRELKMVEIKNELAKLKGESDDDKK
jgi:PAS domain S-box-containing protein